MKSTTIALAALVLAGAAACMNIRENPMEVHVAAPRTAVAPSISTTLGVAYAGTADPEQTLDFYAPAATDFPTVVFVHGGSWNSGTKEMYAGIGTFFQSKGVGCAVINYRLSPRVAHPSHAQDVAAAVAWVHDNAGRYGGSSRVILAGHSAGAHLAALVATDPKYLAAHNLTVGDVSGVIAASGIYLINYNVNLYGVSYVFKGSSKADASPINHVKPGLPPFLLFAADADVPTFDRQARNFQAALLKNRNSASLTIYKGQNHTSIVVNLFTPGNPHEQAMLNFVKGH